MYTKVTLMYTNITLMYTKVTLMYTKVTLMYTNVTLMYTTFTLMYTKVTLMYTKVTPMYTKKPHLRNTADKNAVCYCHLTFLRTATFCYKPVTNHKTAYSIYILYDDSFRSHRTASHLV